MLSTRFPIKNDTTRLALQKYLRCRGSAFTIQNQRCEESTLVERDSSGITGLFQETARNYRLTWKGKDCFRITNAQPFSTDRTPSRRGSRALSRDGHKEQYSCIELTQGPHDFTAIRHSLYKRLKSDYSSTEKVHNDLVSPLIVDRIQRRKNGVNRCSSKNSILQTGEL
jgi:hypothetical protein